MSDCIIWEHAQSGGVAGNRYGVVSYKGRQTYIHRKVWQEAHGPLAPGVQVHHLCGVRLCYNLDHLETMTVAEHRRHHGSTRAAQRTCKNGHPFDKVTKRQRVCSICAREWSRVNQRKYRARKKAALVTATPA